MRAFQLGSSGRDLDEEGACASLEGKYAMPSSGIIRLERVIRDTRDYYSSFLESRKSIIASRRKCAKNTRRDYIIKRLNLNFFLFSLILQWKNRETRSRSI